MRLFMINGHYIPELSTKKSNNNKKYAQQQRKRPNPFLRIKATIRETKIFRNSKLCFISVINRHTKYVMIRSLLQFTEHNSPSFFPKESLSSIVCDNIDYGQFEICFYFFPCERIIYSFHRKNGIICRIGFQMFMRWIEIIWKWWDKNRNQFNESINIGKTTDKPKHEEKNPNGFLYIPSILKRKKAFCLYFR